MGTEISWLLPAALIGLIAVLWLLRSAGRTHRTRAGLLLWGGWLVVTAGVFSFMRGIMHPYYTVALAPAVAAVVAIGTRELWLRRWPARPGWRWPACSRAPGSGTLCCWTAPRSGCPWLRWVLAIGAVLLAVVLAVRGHRLGRYRVAVGGSRACWLGLAGRRRLYRLHRRWQSRRRDPDLRSAVPTTATIGLARRRSPPTTRRWKRW
ncbi:hypothetical protein C1Y40_00188 [Mycobacterium talmoniae]|uniref:Uncharacterized protein n=1 Tax=Mycobacterium talmoniae TaxID=1858794 RepID=A0A2S8BSG0_9MYCO|nr:hypothetical protein C1Y40_00188 [Mycobacterium talmoniae]